MKNMATLQIPESSALHAVARRGIEGPCVLCRQPIAAHIGHQGQWIGCTTQAVSPDTRFILMPDRRAAERPGPSRVPQISVPAATQKASQPTARVVYHAVSKPRLAAALTETDAKVYAVLARRPKHGASRAFLLAALDATERTGIVDGAVRRLRLKGLVKVVRA